MLKNCDFVSNFSLGTGVELAAKVSGIHWQFNTPAHGAELTAGYKNDKYVNHHQSPQNPPNDNNILFPELRRK